MRASSCSRSRDPRQLALTDLCDDEVRKREAEIGPRAPKFVISPPLARVGDGAR
jgi:hypothetical protein